MTFLWFNGDNDNVILEYCINSPADSTCYTGIFAIIGTTSGDRTQDLLIWSLMLYHYTTALPMRYTVTLIFVLSLIQCLSDHCICLLKMKLRYHSCCICCTCCIIIDHDKWKHLCSCKYKFPYSVSFESLVLQYFYQHIYIYHFISNLNHHHL